MFASTTPRIGCNYGNPVCDSSHTCQNNECICYQDAITAIRRAMRQISVKIILAFCGRDAITETPPAIQLKIALITPALTKVACVTPLAWPITKRKHIPVRPREPVRIYLRPGKQKKYCRYICQAENDTIGRFGLKITAYV